MCIYKYHYDVQYGMVKLPFFVVHKQQSTIAYVGNETQRDRELFLESWVYGGIKEPLIDVLGQ